MPTTSKRRSTNATPTKLFAHRGFSSRYPEQTPAAYHAAVDFAVDQGIELGLECDTQFTADDELILLHDATIDRTSNGTGPVFDYTLAELRELDFGSWQKTAPEPAEKSIMTLTELLDLIAAARAKGAPVTLNLETKHPNPRGLDIEERVAELLRERDWCGADSPVRLISFSFEALQRVGELLPNLRRTYLIERTLEPVADGRLPDGIDIVGPDLRLLRDDPKFVARAHKHGNEVHPWTVNTAKQIKFCQDLGITGYTTDYPDRVVEELGADTFAVPVA